MLKPGWMNRYLPAIAQTVVPDVAVAVGYLWAGLMFASAVVNAYVALTEREPARLPPEFGILGTRPARWAAEDVVRARSHGLTRNALAASHTAVVVAEPSLFALQGAAAALEAIDLVRTDNLRLRPAGIIVNKLRAQSVEHRFRCEELRQTYGELVLDPPLPDRAAVQQAEGACVPVQAWRSPGAREVSDALEDHLETLLSRKYGDGPLGVSTSRNGKGQV